MWKTQEQFQKKLSKEKDVFDFFRNNNIFALAYDLNKNYYKNAGASFFGLPMEGMKNKTRKLIINEYFGEEQIYECYENNIREIINFFKDFKDDFRGLSNSRDWEITQDKVHIVGLMKK